MKVVKKLFRIFKLNLNEKKISQTKIFYEIDKKVGIQNTAKPNMRLKYKIS